MAEENDYFIALRGDVFSMCTHGGIGSEQERTKTGTSDPLYGIANSSEACESTDADNGIYTYDRGKQITESS